MRRGAAGLCALLCTGGCGPRAEAGPVARVGDWTLGSERLADLLVLAQPLPLDDVTVDGLVEQWISMAALARRAAAGTDLNGPEALDASLWLERREAVLAAERQTRLRGETEVTAQRTRTEFEADTLRLLAHVLRRVGPFTSEPERQLQRRTAEAILADLRRGGSWLEAVRRSEDAATRASSGLLGLRTVAELPPPLQRAAAALRPGQVSEVVESGDGFHVLHRPRFEDVRDLYARLLAERLEAQADAAGARRLADSLGVRVPPEALETVRALAHGNRGLEDQTPLARWTGDTLAAATAARYIAALPQQDRERLARGPDESVRRFLEQLAVHEARYAIAVAEGIEPQPRVGGGLPDMHRADVAGWLSALTPDGGVPSEDDLDRYMERLVSRQVPLRAVPPLFRRWLLEPLDWSRDRGAQADAVAAARRLLEAATEPATS